MSKLSPNVTLPRQQNHLIHLSSPRVIPALLVENYMKNKNNKRRSLSILHSDILIWLSISLFHCYMHFIAMAIFHFDLSHIAGTLANSKIIFQRSVVMARACISVRRTLFISALFVRFLLFGGMHPHEWRLIDVVVHHVGTGWA